jgi:hypothetical protein
MKHPKLMNPSHLPLISLLNAYAMHTLLFLSASFSGVLSFFQSHSTYVCHEHIYIILAYSVRSVLHTLLLNNRFYQKYF